MMILAFVALQVLDALTTAIYRHMGGNEANPVDAALMQTFGTIGGLIIAKVFTLSLFALLVECSTSKRPVRLAVVAYTLVVGWNVAMISRAVWMGVA